MDVRGRVLGLEELPECLEVDGAGKFLFFLNQNFLHI